MQAKGCDVAALLAFSMPYFEVPDCLLATPQPLTHFPLRFLEAGEPEFFMPQRTHKPWRIANLMETPDLLNQIFDS